MSAVNLMEWSAAGCTISSCRYKNAAHQPQAWLACRLTQELELKQHELELVRQRRAASSSAQLDAAVQASKAGLEEAATAVQAAKQRQADRLQEAKVLDPTGCVGLYGLQRSPAPSCLQHYQACG